jgi:DNA invertase Pin-like site-specific DNA recombinase
MIDAESATVCFLNFGTGKIQSHHRERLAVVYVRQSSPHQVLEHRESAALQYNLKCRAVEWGWPQDRVLVIDQDQGHTGTTVEGRLGFQQLLAELSLDHVGLILGIEMSRLARSNKDWHQLLELCALFGTLLADLDGLYDPQNYNDRLLLGLKGTLSEAELHVLHQRMHEGRLNKARRGELFTHAPTGYVRGPAGQMLLDPDEQVQTVIRLIFRKFDEVGSINALLRYLVRHEIRLGIRPHDGPDRGQLQWHKPNRTTLANLLHRPLYAGAYSWGLRPTDPRRKIPGRPSTGRRIAKTEDCQVLIQDRCPAYITWDQYQANLKRMADNSNRWGHPGAVREGPALLKGLLVCGKCGHRLLVSYGTSHQPRYSCQRDRVDYGGAMCQSLAGRRLDDLVTRQVLRVLEPASLELSLSAAANIQQERTELDRHWRQRLERAGYEVDRAARQYQAVEPENRLVARELERRWEQALLEQRKLQEACDRYHREQPAVLTDADRTIIRSLASDLPALWHSPRTSPADRQQIVRYLVERVVVTSDSASEAGDVQIHFAGGLISHHQLHRSVARYDQLGNYPQLLDRAQALVQQGMTTGQIAEQLNCEGWHPPKRRETFNSAMVQHLLWRRGLHGRRPRGMSADLLGPDEWWFTDLGRALDMPLPTLYSWLRRKWIHARRLPGPQGRWIVWADPDELQRLRQLHSHARDWFNQPQAAELTTPKPRPVTIQKL